MILDSHIHSGQCKSFQITQTKDYFCLSCASSEEEFIQQKKNESDFRKRNGRKTIFCGFGVHPWYLSNKNLELLEEKLKSNSIDFIGETGLDYFSPELRNTAENQREFFEKQIKLALEYDKVLLVHGRKCIEDFFRLKDLLKKLRAVVFHGWSGTYIEAEKMLSEGNNFFFSFGKELIKGRKKSVECAERLPYGVILMETDAPFMNLKGEDATEPEQIISVYKEVCRLKKISFDPDLNCFAEAKLIDLLIKN